MDIDDQAFLDQIEQNIKSKDNEQDDARREAEQRAAEMERIRKASTDLKIPGKSSKPAPASSNVTPAPKNPLENDPRYKEYFERLKRQKGEPAGVSGTSPTPAAGSALNQGSAGKSESRAVGPGAIIRFDDGSIGVYKDAVSGRDYALFYFLNPDGNFVPQGVFLQSYHAKVIGNLPEVYFADLRGKAVWDRDVIVFHLAEYEFVGLLNQLSEHEERKPRNTTPARTSTVSASVPETSQNSPDQNSSADISSAPTVNPAHTPSDHATPKSNEGLVKGRQFQIKFGGKQWDAVYWTSDEQGAIVAHATHGNWSLMRLDLERFKDSLELGEIVDNDIMSAIAQSGAV